MLIYFIAAFISLLFGAALLRFWRIQRQQAEKITALQSQLSALCAAAVGGDERILRFEQTLNKLREHQNTLDLSIVSQTGYDHAIRLARKGGSVQQLIENCNLSDEEAHLITRLHGQAAKSSADLH
ncbi:hypothetical protein MPL1_12848 [Methylophaga lonarensis MPL]|uniref:DUF2802 domain-containing protein n=1 Tax=Methylophaga lonarensis MPL TaxID=1286106 RepID=M7PDH9_9GAMM|nr:DUF2802 domain-containing protein [Methylophaga lonarensis]EMR11950.1 hypothetical protein MPL1_12848 [Methylophaga lonarensis MPL]